jgi:hypothetical protein
MLAVMSTRSRWPSSRFHQLTWRFREGAVRGLRSNLAFGFYAIDLEDCVLSGAGDSYLMQ